MTMPAQFPALQQRGLAKFIKLALDFSANETLDSRITFSRTSNATRTNAQGLIDYAPHNLLTYSEQFDNAVWTKTSGGVGSAPIVSTNTEIAPDGTKTADSIIFNLNGGTTTSDMSEIYYALSPSTVEIRTKSIWAKSLSGNVTIIVGGGGPAVTITNEWQRISIQTNSGERFRVMLRGAQIPVCSNTATLALWGAQLNIGSLQPYYTTSVKNLLGYSQNFENAAWTKSNASIDATPVMGPLGFLGAMKLVENTVAGEHNLSEAITYTAGTPYTLSVYAKAGERNFVVLSYGSGAFGTTTRAYFNLTAGTVGTTVNSPTASIISLGGGWYRCSITKTATVSAAANTIINETSADGVLSYTGDGTSGIYIFGAQLSDSASLDPYVYNFDAAPTSSAYYGPRFDYDPVTLVPKGLLIEEQRINILLNSDTLSTQSVSVTAQAYTLSFYGTGSVALSGAYTGSLVGTGVYPNRVQLTFTPAIGTLTLTVTGSVRYANLEAGAFPTSYIPTTSAQVTRAADNASMVGTNFNSWYNQSEGTVVAEFDTFNTGSGSTIVVCSDNTDSNAHYIRITSNVNKFQVRTFINNSIDVELNFSLVYSINTFYKTAYAYKINDFAAYLPNVLLTDTAGNVPLNLNRLDIGRLYWGGVYLNGHLKSFKFFSKRFINTYLQSLTQ